jgi:hypothetical protein
MYRRNVVADRFTSPSRRQAPPPKPCDSRVEQAAPDGETIAIFRLHQHHGFHDRAA